MEAELSKMRRYLLHHRIATYAIVLFLVLITFILISISKQIENDQALILDSQASSRVQNRTNGANCPAGKPARLVYNGASSCYFGQFRSVTVRCTEGSRAHIIDASTTSVRSVCADGGTCSELEKAAYAYCGCDLPVACGGVPSATPVVPSPTTGPIVVDPTFGTPICIKGVKGLVMGETCATDPDLFQNASYTCLGGKRGSLGSKLSCSSFDEFMMKAKSECARETCNNVRPIPLPTGAKKVTPTPTSILWPTANPND